MGGQSFPLCGIVKHNWKKRKKMYGGHHVCSHHNSGIVRVGQNCNLRRVRDDVNSTEFNIDPKRDKETKIEK
jgi:hypothetical protein